MPVDFFSHWGMLAIPYLILLTVFPKQTLLLFPIQYLVLKFNQIELLPAIIFVACYFVIHPYLIITFLAYYFYWPTNPILCFGISVMAFFEIFKYKPT